MGLKRPIGILQNQTNGLLQLILYKRHGKVVGDTVLFERLTQGVTEEAHALGTTFPCAIFTAVSLLMSRFAPYKVSRARVLFCSPPKCTPPLTTMQVQKQRLGALAVDRLHTRLQKNVPETLREALVPEVLVRESVLDRRNPPDRSTCW